MTHRINHAELEVTVGARELGEQMLERLSLLRERRIAPVIDRVCSELSGPDRFDRIERIELELGAVALADFDDDFLRKLESALRAALLEAVPARADPQARIEAALELLEIFAWTGNLPWWADASSSDPVRTQIEILMGEAPRALLELLGELAKDKAALARVLRHADTRALVGRLRGHADPTSAALRGEMLEQLLEAELGASLVAIRRADERAETFDALLREPTRTHGLSRAEAERGELMSAAIDDGQVLLREHSEESQLAQQLHALLCTLMAVGRAALASTAPEERLASETLETLLRDLAEDGRLHAWVVRELERATTEHDDDAPEPWASSDEQPETVRTRVLLRELAEQPPLAERLRALLQNVPAASERSETFEALLLELVEEPRLAERLHVLLQALLAAGRAALAQPPAEVRSETFEALLRELTEDRRLRVWVTRELERALARRHGTSDERSSQEQPRATVATHALLLNRITAASGADVAPLEEHPARLSSREAERGAPAPADPLAKQRAPSGSSSNARAAEHPAAARVARRRAVERLEEIYVDNAGLVLLWPFLARFYARVGLLDDKQRFVDEPARMQAIALLELLARAELEPPEFRLPLAKLLCGLAPIDEFELARPLAAEQIDECESLLMAVIDNAPILRAMSVPSFRASFLLRSAVLSTRDGAWLLQVERADYDVVLERFPWSWDWLKLPWMPDALRVEW